MIYSFDTQHAEKYGVNEAILLHNILYWLLKNKANESHIHEGKVWTFNSAEAFCKLFPFWSRRKVARILESLESKGAIESGNFNENKYDRTKWYSSPLLDSLDKSSNSNGRNCPKNRTEVSNQLVESVQPIPDSNTNRNTDKGADDFYDAETGAYDVAAMRAYDEQGAAKRKAIRLANAEAYRQIKDA